jgi:hypothetical protein
MDESNIQFLNADFSRHESWELAANVTVEREEQPSKQFWPSFLTEAGMEIDDRDEQCANA